MFIYIDCYFNLFYLNLNNLIFNINFNISFIHNFFIFYRSNLRIGSRSQKNRSSLNFSTRKLYRQKGTGKSRAGSLSSPIRRKGSRSFPNYFFENFNYKILKKNFKFIIFFIISKLIISKKFYLIDDFFFIKISTKNFLKKINFLNFNNLVFLTFYINLNFFLSQKNIFNFKIINLFNLNPIILIKYDFILFSFCSINFFY